MLFKSTNILTFALPLNMITYVKFDNGALNHYIPLQYAKSLTDVIAHKGPLVILPDADTITPSHFTIIKSIVKNCTHRYSLTRIKEC